MNVKGFSMNKKLILISVVAALALATSIVFAESQTQTGLTSATLLFGAKDSADGNDVVALSAISEKDGSVILAKTRPVSVPAYEVKSATAAGATIIPLKATGVLASNDMVAFSGTVVPFVRTVIGISNNFIRLSAATSVDLAQNDKVHQMVSCYSLPVGSNVISVVTAPQAIIKANGGSPLYLTLDGVVTNTSLSATTKK